MKLTVRNKNELIETLKRCNPGDIISVYNTDYELAISTEIHDVFLTSIGCNPSKRYRTNLDKLIASVKRTPEKIWSC